MHNRYRIESIIDQGGMGTVSRAYDRLTDTWVALKQLTLELEGEAEDTIDFAETATLGSPRRLALAAEFRLLATLRHPYVVSVLDYGFVNDTAFFTMEFLSGATNFVQAARGQPLTTQLTLLAQFFQALEYIRRHQVVHRDLKPANVLVQQGQVKVLDFGIAALEGVRSPTAGSLLYMAPEGFSSQPFTHVTDLFSAGVMAYEVLAGHHPFEATRREELIHKIQTAEPDYEALNGPPSLRPVLARLLAKDPAARFATAGEALAALVAASGEALPQETQATRASLIQAAQFVGRETELTQLLGAFAQAQTGRGSAWLLGGESGVGKSRLLEELRIQALVRQALVWQGQAVREGAQPMQTWRNVLLWLLLVAAPTDAEAAVLQPFVPYIEDLLDRPIPAAPALAASAAQERVGAVVLALLRRAAVKQTIVLILEDLHWIGSLSQAVLAKVMREVASLPILIVGTYRNDELPTLPQQLPPATLLTLNRLSNGQVAQLTSAILGLAPERISTLVAFLYQETEGNAFFVVEVLRSLAEEAGLLSEVQTLTLPEHLLVGGIQQVVQRRLQRMEETDYHPWLELVAVAGRELNLPLLQHLAPLFDWQAWLSRCAEVAVVEPQGAAWRFAHDQVRQGVLAVLKPARAIELHQTIAAGLEQLYATDLGPRYAELAHHYHQAQKWEKAQQYHRYAGDAANSLYALPEARLHYNHALEALHELPETSEYCRYRTDTLIKRVAVSWAADDVQQNFARLREAEHWLQLVVDPEVTDALLRGRILYWLGRLHYVRNEMQDAMGYYRQALAVGREFNDAELLAIPSAFLGHILSTQGQVDQAGPLLAQALTPLAQTANWAEWLRTMGAYGLVLARQGHYAASLQENDQGLSRAKDFQHSAGLALIHVYRGSIYLASYEMPEMLAESAIIIENAERAGERMLSYMGYGLRAWAHARLNEMPAAQQARAQSVAIAQTIGNRLLGSDAFSVLDAEIALNLGQPTAAIEMSNNTVTMAQARGDVFVQGIAHGVWGRACVALPTPDWPAAQAHLAESAQILTTSGNLLYAAHTHLVWGQLCATQNDLVAARAHLTHALAQYQASQLPHLIAQAEAALQALPNTP